MSVPVAGRWRAGHRVHVVAEPEPVARGQAAVGPAALQHGVDEADQIGRDRADARPRRRRRSAAARPPRSAGPARPARPAARRRWTPRPPARAAAPARSPAGRGRVTTSRRSGSARSTSSVVEPREVHTALAGQVLHLAHPAAHRHQHALRHRQVGGGELHDPLPGAGHGEAVHHDVDLAVLDRGRPVGDVQHHELHPVRIAEDRCGDPADDVDVGALSSPVSGFR